MRTARWTRALGTREAFWRGVGSSLSIDGLLIQPNGQMVVTGLVPVSSTSSAFMLTRINANGSPDTTFGVGGFVQTSVSGNTSIDGSGAAALQSDGKIVLAGDLNGNLALLRFDSNGQLNTSFGNGGEVGSRVNVGNEQYGNGVVIQPNGQIVEVGTSFVGSSSGSPIPGHTYEVLIRRFSSAGSPDTSFGTNGVATYVVDTGDKAAGVALESDGKIVVTGTAINTGSYEFWTARFEFDGSLDTTFGNNGAVVTASGPSASEASAIAIQSDNKILITGSTSSGGDWSLVRYLNDISPYTVTNTNDSGSGSLRQAILNANASTGGVLINFDIPGTGVQTIAPLTTLPPLTESVTIDGETEPGYSGTPLIQLSGASLRTGNTSIGLWIRSAAISSRVSSLTAGPGTESFWRPRQSVDGNLFGHRPHR